MTRGDVGQVCRHTTADDGTRHVHAHWTRVNTSWPPHGITVVAAALTHMLIQFPPCKKIKMIE
ncbi:hypothetical protein E2C01_006918 [Portunus trituberculatus]|uniref:Uncharacterized protein n=1 Tax=Portunus trituberculatus TaxID=210409 RepID=A0A5B7CZ38_PORTR|nr:hypothetical protein [Portunus trituberculatus]